MRQSSRIKVVIRNEGYLSIQEKLRSGHVGTWLTWSNGRVLLKTHERLLVIANRVDLFRFAKMAGGGDQRLRYVNLTTDERGPFEEIRPGELNQPIDVPSFPKCDRCRQPLPENFTPLADEPWTTGIFGCAEDPDSCRTGLICPCVLYGRNVERLRDDGTRWIAPCICHAVFCEGGIALAATTAALAFHGIGEALLVLGVGVYACWCGIATFAGTDRHLLQKKYYLEDSPCTAPAVHCCCLHWCALCQEHREMKARLSDRVVAPGTVVDPPPVQEMINGSRDDNGTTPSPGRSVGRNNLELQAL